MTSGLRWTAEAYEAFQKERHAARGTSPASSYPRGTPAAPRAAIAVSGLSADDAKVLRAHASMQRFQALGRLPKDEMNGTERAYAQEVLEPRRVAGEILAWDFHPFNVRLAANTFYEVDWLVIAADRGVEIHETKGGLTTDKGQLKLKLCGARLPFFRVFKVTRLRRKDGGGWRVVEYSA